MKTAMKLALVLALYLGAWQTNAQTYCEYQFGFAWCGPGWAIDDITIGSFTESNSGCNSGAYNNNTTASMQLQKGAAIPFNLSSGGTAVQWAIWIDLNSDGDFTDPTDYFWGSTSPSTSASGTIVIPTSATATTTRIRIASRNQSLAIVQNDACNFGFQAETQDFQAILNAPGGCSVPVNLQATASVTEAFLSWDSVGTQYNLEYGLKGFVPGSGTTLNPTTDTLTLTGLTANTWYDFYVQNDCSTSSGDSSSWNGPISFTTQCTEISTFPHLEGFNDSTVWIPNTGYNTLDDTISNCWDRYPEGIFGYIWVLRSGSTPSTNTGPQSGYGPGYYMHIEQAGIVGDEATFTSPLFNTNSMTVPYLSFYYHMYGLNMGTLYVEVSTNSGSSWTTLDSIVGQQQASSTAAWLQRGIDVSAYKSASFAYRFRAKYTQSGTRGDMAIDEVLLAEAPACPPVSSFQLTNITGSSVSANWNSSNNQFILEIGQAGFTQGTGSVDTVSSNSHSFSNLGSDTWWDVYILSDCSASGNGTSGWAGPYTFRTYVSPAWNEDFNTNGFLPNNRWSEAIGAIGNPTTFTNTYSGWGEDGWLNMGFSGSVRTYISSFSSEQDWFFTERIDLGTGSNWELYFDAAVTASSSSSPGSLESDDTLKVVISTDGGLTWYDSNTILTIDQSNNLSNSGQTFVASLSGYSGVIKVGFYMESTIANTNSLDFFIDNMGIRVPVNCPAPTGLNAYNVGPNDLWIGWTNTISPGSYFIEYGPTGFTQGTGTIASGITVDSAQISGLLPVTEYDFYIHSVCGVDTSAPSLLTALTGCPGTFATPYQTNFDVLVAGNPPLSGTWENCWVSSNPTGYKYRWQTGDGASQWANTGPNADHTTGIADDGIYMYTEASQSGLEATLINGPFDLTQIPTPTLSFWYHMYGADIGELHVDISTDQINWNNSVFALIGEQHQSKTDPWLQAKLALSQYKQDSIYIRFRGVKGPGSNGDMAIDDVFITNAGGCISPTGLNAINQTTTSAELVWGSYSPSHTIEWGPQGFVQGTGAGTIVSGISGSSYILTGLSTATGYDFYVKDTCTGSSWIGPKTFYTSCAAPYIGTYTVGGASGTFSDLEEALESMKNCGVSGPVTLSLQGVHDTLSYTFKSNEIPGLSATNGLTIEGNGNDSLYAIPTSNYLFELFGAEFITIKNVSLFNTFGNFVIWMHDQTHNITIENCTIYGYSSSSINYSSAGIAATAIPTSSSSQGQNAHDIILTGNTIHDGYSGVSFYGESNTHINNLVIENNILINPYYYGLRISYVDSSMINQNKILDLGTNSGGYGIYLFRVNVFEIIQNEAIAPGSALYISSGNQPSPSAPSLIENNMLVSSTSGDGAYISSTNHIDIFHNSMYGYNHGIRITGFSGNGDDYDIRNNIFKSNSQEAFYNSAPGLNLAYNYNVYYSINGDVAWDGGSAYASLSAWQTGVSGQNANSVENDPGFASSTDLHIVGIVPNDIGDTTVNVSVDIDGDIRPAAGSTNVDIGADEFTPKTDDIAIETIYRPLSGCGDSTIEVSVIIKNFGTNVVTSVPVTANITGDITATLNNIYSGSLNLLEADTFIVGSINTYTGAQSISIQAITNLSNDQDASNDTAHLGPLFFIPVVPAFEKLDTVCASNMGTVTLQAEQYDGVFYGWYANQNDTIATAIGDTFTTSLSGQTDWYLGYLDAIQDSLQVNNFGSLFGGSGGLMFDITAKTNLQIDSLHLHIRTNVGNTDDLIVYYIANDSYTNHTSNPGNWTLLDTISYVGAGANTPTKITLPNPLSISSGATYAIYLVYDAYWETGNSINQVVNTPFMRYEGGVGFWNGAFSGLSNNRTLDGIIHAHNVVCSNTRTLVSIPIYADTADAANASILISQPNKVDVDASAVTGDLIEWNFGDGNTSTSAVATHVYTNGGQYTVTCTVTDTVCNTIDSAAFTVNMTIGIDENALAKVVDVYPNPSEGMFNLHFPIDAHDVTITVVDMVGHEIMSTTLNEVNSGSEYHLDLADAPSGLYFIKIDLNGQTAVKKVTKL